MYADSRFKIRREYEKIAIKCLDSKVHRLSFKEAVSQAEQLLNARVFFLTKGNVKRMFDSGT